jgi:Ca-activated chloride channel homolog
MLEFAHPWAFLLAPLPLLAWVLLPPHRERVSAVRVPFFRQLAQAANVEPRQGSFVERRSLVRTVVLLAIWLLLVCAVALPQWVGAPIEREESARDLILAVDLSSSMDQRDIESGTATPLSRLDVVKQVIGEFIASRDSDRIGLIVFGSQAYVQLPFTRDREVAQTMLQATVPGMAGPHTALGDAIGLAIRTFEASEVEDRLLIVLTDGADTGSRMSPINAAQIAADNGVRIMTIGFGDPDGKGENKVDFGTLEDIAETADGAFFSASDAATLESIYQRIDEMEPQIVKTLSYVPRESLIGYPVGAATLLGLLALLATLAVGRGRAKA